MDDELLFRSVTGRSTPEETEAVVAWLGRSPANEQRFHDTLEILRLAAYAEDEIGFGAAPAAAELLAKRGQHAGNQLLSRGHGAARRRLLLTAAAAAVVVIAAWPSAQRWLGNSLAPQPTASVFRSDEFVTESEPATVGLSDGTVVRLAPESRLRVHAREDGREVTLDGRGYFSVAPDPAQPFTVRSGAGTVTVLGTRFDVTVSGEDLRVIVIEGSVRLTVRGSQVVVGAGQLAQVLKGVLVPPIAVPDPASLVGWVGNFIAFHDTPLSAVVREIEQRFGVRIELSEASLGDRTVTALFAGRSYEEIAEVICVVTHLRCTRHDGVLRMAPAR
jgi:ferric-dicitrate binding protein FerR (iron transport regulator)